MNHHVNLFSIHILRENLKKLIILWNYTQIISVDP